MTKPVVKWAKSNDYIVLAKHFIKLNLPREGVLGYMKNKNYIIKGIKFNAVEVLTLMEFFESISADIKDGSIKSTKKQGLTIVI